jgi:hypothetical protein
LRQRVSDLEREREWEKRAKEKEKKGCDWREEEEEKRFAIEIGKERAEGKIIRDR